LQFAESHAGSLKGWFVNKSEMIDAIARHADISKAAAGRALDATVGAIKTSLRKGDIVTLVGFGSFYVGKRSPRAGRNPRTGDAIEIQVALTRRMSAVRARQHPPAPNAFAMTMHFEEGRGNAALLGGITGVVVQLVRIPACHAGGRGFESRPLRQQNRRANASSPFFIIP
jgi:DNA-binding protein HU-beta